MWLVVATMVGDGLLQGGHRVSLRVGGLLIGPGDLGQQLLAVHGDASRCGDAQADDLTPNVQHRDYDVVADHDALANPATENQHALTLPWDQGNRTSHRSGRIQRSAQ